MHLQFITCKHAHLFPFSHANTQSQTHSGLNSIFTYAMQIWKLNTAIKITDLQLCNWDQNMVLTLSYINFHSCSWICLFPQPPLCALIIQHLNQPSTCCFLLCQWKLFSINYKTHSPLRFSWLFFISGWKCQFTVIFFCLQKYPVYQLYCRTHSLCERACECVCELVNVWPCECICKIGNACAYMCICRKDMEIVFGLKRLNVSQALFYSLNFNHFLKLKIFILEIQMISGYKAKRLWQLQTCSKLSIFGDNNTLQI